MSCPGPFEKFEAEIEADMKKASAGTGSSKNRLGSTGSTGLFMTSSSGNRLSGVNRSSNIDVKIDWLIKTVKEIKDETACKKEMRMMVKEIVREELESIKQELGDLRRMIQEGVYGSSGGAKRSYSEAEEKRKYYNCQAQSAAGRN